MSSAQKYSLEPLRMDGWFEQVAATVVNFSELCDIIGEQFFAFSLIVGAKIATLSVDKKKPDRTMVGFTIGSGEPASNSNMKYLSLGEFKRRLVSALLAEESEPEIFPKNVGDHEAMRAFFGLRYLLLAPLFKYELLDLWIGFGSHPNQVELSFIHDGELNRTLLADFRSRIRLHVQDVLDGDRPGDSEWIDLAKVAEAEEASNQQQWSKVMLLLGAWPIPLSVLFRTAEGQSLAGESRATIARAMGLLGTACVRLSEAAQGEDIFRLGLQYAGDEPAAGDLFLRLGESQFRTGRLGEAIGPLRAAVLSGASPKEAYVLLGRALMMRSRYVASLACFARAIAHGEPLSNLSSEMSSIEKSLGPSIHAWKRILFEVKD